MRRREGYRNLFKNNCLLSKYKLGKGLTTRIGFLKSVNQKNIFLQKVPMITLTDKCYLRYYLVGIMTYGTGWP